jgi:hypothetical protein
MKQQTVLIESEYHWALASGAIFQIVAKSTPEASAYGSG